MWGNILKNAARIAGWIIFNWKYVKPFYDDTLGKLFKKKGDKNKPDTDPEADTKPEGTEEGETESSTN